MSFTVSSSAIKVLPWNNLLRGVTERLLKRVLTARVGGIFYGLPTTKDDDDDGNDGDDDDDNDSDDDESHVEFGNEDENEMKVKMSNEMNSKYHNEKKDLVEIDLAIVAGQGNCQVNLPYTERWRKMQNDEITMIKICVVR